MVRRSAAHANNLATTGVDSLDAVLGGGIPRGSVVFVTGLPGAGKTILCEQALFANAEKSQSVLYVTTLSEPPIKMLRFSANFDFFRPELIDRSVRYADLGSALGAGGPDGAIAQLKELIEQHRPDFLVLDSFKVFREYFDEVKAFRVFASDVMILLATWEVTALLVGEYAFEHILSEPEFAIADGILHLSGTEESVRQKRHLNVVKMRGTDAFLGQHFFDIGDDGITLYPRMLPKVQSEYVVSSERLSSSIRGLTEMMSGGILLGSTALISGGTGSGKTLTALSFAVDASRKGVPCLYVTFEEAPQQLVHTASGVGWDLSDVLDQGTFSVLHVSPSELDLDRHAIVIKDRAEHLQARLVVIDSITAFEMERSDVTVLKDYLWGISDYFKRTGITLILTTEAYSFFESSMPQSERRVAQIADSVILLRLVEDGDRVCRKISVLKMRGSDHDSSLRELQIAPNQISLENGP